MNLDDITGAQLAANPRLARAYSRAWKKEAKRLGLPRRRSTDVICSECQQSLAQVSDCTCRKSSIVNRNS